MLRDKYKITSKLSEGRKFGTIYLGEEISSQQKVVIKALKKNGNNTTAVQQLSNEALFTFSVPGLPHILEKIETESEILVIKSFEQGIPLNEFWKKIKKRDRINFLIALFQKLNILLSSLYDNQILHLDLKPGNILIEGTTEDFEVKIIDFGLAINKAALPERTILFPLGYAAPELILNRLDLADERTDLFALGICMFVLYTEKLPLSHPNPSIYTNLQITHPIPSSPAIPKELFRIIEKMTHKYQFAKPPNHLPENELTSSLIEGMDGRYSDLSSVISELQKIRQKRPFYQRISFR